ncbi:MAG: hypothetical protein ACKOWG_08210, partial [Planctomycetia bacterium]
MAKSANKTSKKTAKPAIDHQKRTAKAIASAIAKARKASGKRGGDDADIHVHVGDVVMMGFDEAVDAEEWGARETNNELGGAKGRRGRPYDRAYRRNPQREAVPVNTTSRPSPACPGLAAARLLLGRLLRRLLLSGRLRLLHCLELQRSLAERDRAVNLAILLILRVGSGVTNGWDNFSDGVP